MKKIGILGGTFDPIHKGHIFLAETVLNECGLDKIMFLPLNAPPHKNPPVATAKQRYEMIEKSIEYNPCFFASDMEIRRSGTTYTVDTLKSLKSANPDWAIYYIIGTDALFGLEKWKDIEKVFELCTFVCMTRPVSEAKGERAKAQELGEKFGKDVIIVSVTGEDISSTMVRNAGEDELFSLVPAQIIDMVSNIYAKEERTIERQQILDKIKELISSERYEHTLRTEQTAIELAKKHGADIEKASLAALLHDSAKAISKDPEEFSKRHGIDKYLDRYKDLPLPLLHAPMGAHLVKVEFGIDDEEILSAITWHTTGKADMSLLDKIIYLADYIEPGRGDSPELENIRFLANTDLDTALFKALERSIEHIKSKGRELQQNTLEAYEYIKGKIEKRESELLNKMCRLLSSKKAENICIIDIGEQSVIADYFVICHARTTIQTKAIYDFVEEELEKSGVFALRKEGIGDGRWIVLDYTNIILHIFLKEEREFYNLEKLWNNGNNMSVYKD